MPRIAGCGLIQATCDWSPEESSLRDIKQNMIAKHERMIAAAARKNVQVLFQDHFYGPYFCAEQRTLVRFDRARARRATPTRLQIRRRRLLGRPEFSSEA